MVFGFLTSFSHTGYYLNVLLWLWKIGNNNKRRMKEMQGGIFNSAGGVEV